ncbi:MAG TPA: RluA family pseudouridine synthase [Ktedonobacteraceae bacterium]|nr:RluA family pseudouridine synthase [Ktedonobacteraceae bacterium]
MTQATIDIPVIYQDHHLLIVNKPAGLVVHPTYKHADGTMWDSILAYLAEQGGDSWQPEELPDKPEWAGAPEHIQVMLREQQRAKQWQEEGLLSRPCLLHRIDKDTSGIVALARTGRARRHLIRQFYDHSIVKRYLAVVRKGSPDWTKPRAPFSILAQDGSDQQPVEAASLLTINGVKYTLDGSLQRDPVDRRRCIVGPDGQAAMTQVQALAVQGEYALLEARPITGRTHQIRAHLAAAGYAIVGDKTYALPASAGIPAAKLARQFLHAYSLELRSYPDNERKTFVAPLADDLAAWLAAYLSEGLEIINAGKTIRA